MTNELRLLQVLVRKAKRAGRVDVGVLVRASGGDEDEASDIWAPLHAEVRASVRRLARGGYLVLAPDDGVSLTLHGLAVGAAALSARRRGRVGRPGRPSSKPWSERARAA